MLVLSRQLDQTIMIGDEIEVTVVAIRGDKVRIGISAPARIGVHRKEVYEAIKKETAETPKVNEVSIALGPQRRNVRLGAMPEGGGGA